MRSGILCGVLLAVGLSACTQPNPGAAVIAPAPVQNNLATLIRRAQAGDDNAAIALAAAYIGLHNPPEAFKWMKHAADHGSANAEAGTGKMYELGFGVPQDYSQALAYDRRSADQNNSAGLNNLAGLYETGHGVPIDVSQAAQMYHRSALLGNPYGQASLARFYAAGLGMPKDTRLAYFWSALAAAKLNDAAWNADVKLRDDVAKTLPPDTVTSLQAAARIWQPGTEPPATTPQASSRPSRRT